MPLHCTILRPQQPATPRVLRIFRNGGIIVERAVIEQGGSPGFVVYGAVLLTYFVVCSALTRVTRGLERRYDPQHRATLVPADAPRRGA